ncbi:MAG: GAF domain-containing sensor histidine kinase [Cytophagales bacterium]|nr:GAF domain-containing sensor histidine kinase [Armatimonadota bacterium]
MNSPKQVTSDNHMPPREAELAAALAHRERQIEAIRRTSEALFSHPSVDAMVAATLKTALDVLRADAGTVFLHDPADDTLVFRYVIGGAGEQLVGQRVPVAQGVSGTVFRTGIPIRTGDVRERADHNVDIEKQTGYKTQSLMTVPVKRTGGDPIGVMQVLNARIPFTDRDLEVFEVLCAQAATGIEHAQLAEEARKAQIVNVIGDISHDIKNMLTPILTGVWTLEPMLRRLFEEMEDLRSRCGDPYSEEVSRIADSVRHDYGWILASAANAAEQVQGRTKEIADAVKGELSPPFFETANLNDTCHEVALPLRTVAERGKVRLLLDLDETLPLLEFDRRQMYNALYNLVNNALPETPPDGSVTLRTRGPLGEGGDRQVTIEVQDTGRGIPEAVRTRLFTDQAVSTKPGGTGLGTRIVAGVIRRHNGTIRVDSIEGQGTTFTVRIPLRHQAA